MTMEKKMAELKQREFWNWVNSLVRFGASPNSYIQWDMDRVTSDGKYYGDVAFYTRTHIYYITCRVSIPNLKTFKDESSYLGCVVSARKPIAGETHYRGNDLADGEFSVETWNKIVLDIVRYELVKISHSARRENK